MEVLNFIGELQYPISDYPNLTILCPSHKSGASYHSSSQSHMLSVRLEGVARMVSTPHFQPKVVSPNHQGRKKGGTS